MHVHAYAYTHADGILLLSGDELSCDESAPRVVMNEQHLRSCLSTNLRE